MSEKLFISLFKSEDKSSILLALLLMDWNFKKMRDFLMRSFSSGENDYYIAFCTHVTTLTICSSSLNIRLDLPIPLDKQPKEQINSWS